MRSKLPSAGKTYYHGFDPLPLPPGAVDKTDQGAYIPTPAEIESACAEIRKGWRWDDERTNDSIPVTMVSARDWNLTVDCSEF
jgi:hypothetical protein